MSREISFLWCLGPTCGKSASCKGEIFLTKGIFLYNEMFGRIKSRVSCQAFGNMSVSKTDAVLILSQYYSLDHATKIYTKSYENDGVERLCV